MCSFKFAKLQSSTMSVRLGVRASVSRGGPLRAPKASPGERIAVLSPSFAAAGAFPAVHEQTMRRLVDITGLVPVEYPTTRQVGAPPSARARDINAAFADSQIRGILGWSRSWATPAIQALIIGGATGLSVITVVCACGDQRGVSPKLL